MGGLVRQKDLDYLFIGSSHVRSSYDVKQIEESTGIKGYAFSYAYFSYPFAYQVLKYFIEDDEDVDVNNFNPVFTVYDIFLLMEMLSFVKNNDKYEAEAGKHDDMIFATAIAVQLYKIYAKYTSISKGIKV